MSADLADLPAVAVRVSKRLTAAGIRHAISGSIAGSFHGYVRGTIDVDMLVAAPAADIARLLEATRGTLDAGLIRRLLASVVPADDSRHAMLERLLLDHA